MKTGWQTTTLGDICQLEPGKPLAQGDRKVTGPYPVYGADGEIARTGKYYFDKPTVIVGRKGTVGELNLTEKRFWPLEDTYFATFDEEQYDLQFLYYLLLTVDLHSFAKGAKPHLNRSEIYAQAVMVPALPEQQRIGSILSTAFTGIELAHGNTAQNLQSARALCDSHPHGAGAKTAASRDIVGRTPGIPGERERTEALCKQTQHLESLCRRKLVALDELRKLLLQRAFVGEL